MNLVLNAILGLTFVGIGAAATLLMLWLRGRVPRPGIPATKPPPPVATSANAAANSTQDCGAQTGKGPLGER